MWFDESVVESVTTAIPVPAAIVLLVVSYLGSIYLIMPTAVAVYLRGRDWQSGTWPGILLGAYALFVALKPLTAIPRPAERGVESPLAGYPLPTGLDHLHEFAVAFDTGSFPSGHAIAVTVFCGLLVADIDIGTPLQRVAVGVVWVGGVCFSRVALGTHYVGDIVGGILIALAFLGLVFVVRRRLAESPLRGVGPVEGTAAIAAVPALVAVPAGRPIEGVVLLGALVGVLVVHRTFGIRNVDFRQVLSG